MERKSCISLTVYGMQTSLMSGFLQNQISVCSSLCLICRHQWYTWHTEKFLDYIKHDSKLNGKFEKKVHWRCNPSRQTPTQPHIITQSSLFLFFPPLTTYHHQSSKPTILVKLMNNKTYILASYISTNEAIFSIHLPILWDATIIKCCGVVKSFPRDIEVWLYKLLCPFNDDPHTHIHTYICKTK